jgi:hypothetical protein
MISGGSVALDGDRDAGPPDRDVEAGLSEFAGRAVELTFLKDQPIGTSLCVGIGVADWLLEAVESGFSDLEQAALGRGATRPRR